MIHKPTQCVSFPRSGYHALAAVMGAYFGEAPGYGEEHDLALDFPDPQPGTRLLVQMRNPINAIQSWTDLDARFGEPDRNSTRELWTADFNMKIDIWNRWYQKWVVAERPNRIVVFYERLLADPFGVCEAVVQFLTVEQADAGKLKRALAEFPIIDRGNKKWNWFVAV